jgi:hypothetical protein
MPERGHGFYFRPRVESREKGRFWIGPCPLIQGQFLS